MGQQSNLSRRHLTPIFALFYQYKMLAEEEKTQIYMLWTLSLHRALYKGWHKKRDYNSWQQKRDLGKWKPTPKTETKISEAIYLLLQEFHVLTVRKMHYLDFKFHTAHSSVISVKLNLQDLSVFFMGIHHLFMIRIPNKDFLIAYFFPTIIVTPMIYLFYVYMYTQTSKHRVYWTACWFCDSSCLRL